MNQLNKVSEIVEQCLQDDPYCKENDMWLILSVWRKQGAKIVIQTPLSDLVSCESIRRCRQLYNARGEYLPNNPEVLRQRRLKQEIVREFVIENGG